MTTILKKAGLDVPIRRLYHKRYARRRTQFYSKFVKRGDLCFDIGTNIGTRIDVFLALGASVVAVEPQTICIKYLQKKYCS